MLWTWSLSTGSTCWASPWSPGTSNNRGCFPVLSYLILLADTRQFFGPRGPRTTRELARQALTMLNEATWRWCEPTCLCLPIWPLPMTHVTFDLDHWDLLAPDRLSNTLCKIHPNLQLWHGDLDLWPSHVTYIPLMFITIPNLVTISHTVSEIWIIVQ